MVAKEGTDLTIVIPVVHRSRVVDQFGPDLGALVPAQDREPNDMDGDGGRRILVEDVFLHRTGARLTNPSSRGQEQNQLRGIRLGGVEDLG